jgi:uncharacterized protein YkwD
MEVATLTVPGRTLVRAGTALLTTGALLLTAGPARASAPAPCPGSAVVPSAQTLEATAGAVVCLVNVHRSTHGLHSLTASADLTQAAGRHSRDMVRRAFFAHVTPTGRGPSERIRRSGFMHGIADWSIGEDLAWGTGSLSTPDATVAAWIASPAHERVLLDTGFRQIGVGIAVGVPVATAGSATGATYTLDSGQTGR